MSTTDGTPFFAIDNGHVEEVGSRELLLGRAGN